MRRHLLVVAYDFPPFAHVACQRPAKLVRDLAELGWRSTVITPGARRDVSLDRETERWVPASARVVTTACSPLRPVLGALNRARPGWGAVASRWIVPDADLGWVPVAVAAALRVVRRDRPHAMWTTCGPHSVALAGRWLARRCRVPWILDLCNEWTGNPYFQPPTPWHRRLHAALERRLIAAADAVTTLNPAHTDLLARTDPARRDRFVTVEGGVDVTDAAVSSPRSKVPRPLTFTYTGSMYGLQGPGPLIETLENLMAAGTLPASDARVRLVGPIYEEGMLRPRRLRVEIVGRVPHAQVTHELAASDVLFFCLPKPLERQLPTKLYEYMASDRPILAVAPPGSVAGRRVRERGAGWVAEAEDRVGLARAVREIYDLWKEGRLPSVDGPASVAPYTRFRMAETLARLLDRLTAGRIPDSTR